MTPIGKPADAVGIFVRRFLEASGASVEAFPNGIQAALPEELARILGVPREHTFWFSPGEGAENDVGEAIVQGSPVLDRMMQLASARGLSADLLIGLGLNAGLIEAVQRFDPFRREKGGDGAGTAPPGLRRLHAAAGRLRFPNARPRLVGRAVVYHTQLLFFFKASYISDEKREALIPLIVDPVTEAIDRPVDLGLAAEFPAARAISGDPQAYAVERLYRRAREHVARRVARDAEAHRAEASERLSKELARIEGYYSGLFRETVEPLRKLFRRMAAAKVRAELARSWKSETKHRDLFERLRQEAESLERRHDQEIEALNREKEQRIAELREKHAVRAEIRLTHAALIRVPRVAWRVRLASRGGSRELPLTYDLLRRRFVDWMCEGCSREILDAAYLCGCESLVCDGCAAVCDGCGGVTCPACAPGRCHVCDRSLCSECETACPAAARLPGAAGEIRVCRSCRASGCDECRGAALFFAESTLPTG